MAVLRLHEIGPIKQADITFGDLTVFVGPQASGKSIALQWLKLALDLGSIQRELLKYGVDWEKIPAEFMEAYFGEGMSGLWDLSSSEATWNGKSLDPRKLAPRIGRLTRESVFLIPAQRVLTLREGWPRPFGDFAPGDPYAVRAFSERLRGIVQYVKVARPVLAEIGLGEEYSKLAAEQIFTGLQLVVQKRQSQRRLLLGDGPMSRRLPFMMWSTGQREFVPLLLGLNWLMPTVQSKRRSEIQWVIIEEPEMGLHPRAIGVVLVMVLDLMARGYRVCLSTHSTQILEFAWALNLLAKNGGTPSQVLELLGVEPSSLINKVAKSALQKSAKVYYFEQGTTVTDISSLDPSSDEDAQASWGGLVSASARVNEVVATVMANAPGV